MENLNNTTKEANFEVLENISLSKYTTWGIGGEAEFLLEANSQSDIINGCNFAKDNNLKVRILGLGANTLIPDNGIKGLVIINKSTDIKFLNKEDKTVKRSIEDINYKPDTELHKRHAFQDFELKEKGKRILVEFNSGVKLSVAINKTLNNRLSGLHNFSGIPSTMGGALYNNIHTGTHQISEYFHSAKLLDVDTGKVKEYQKDFFQFGYDESILRGKPNLIVLSVTLSLFKSDNKQIKKAKEINKNWLLKKQNQPRNTAGCVFKNIPKHEKEKNNFQSTSVGYLVDKMGLKGLKIGGVQISQAHGNFIENTDNGSAKDVLELIKKIKVRVWDKYKIKLEEEIHLLQ